MSTKPQAIQTRHVLAVHDLAVSAAYYIDKLGFERDFAVDGWEFLSLDGFKIMLGHCPDEASASETNNHSYFAHVIVTDVDELFENFQQRGAAILLAPEDKPWGLREFGVVTPDGHRICFAQEIQSA